MHRARNHRRSDCSAKSKGRALKIVLVYDGFTDLIRAHELWSGLVARFKSEMQIAGRAWNFSLLRDPRTRLKAALHTADANLVVFSASGRTELPEHMRNWIGAWIPWKKGRHDALVAMLDRQSPPSPAAFRLCQYLRQTAQKTGMDFFCNADQTPPRLDALAGA